MQPALNDSLAMLDNIFHDFFTEHENNTELTDSLKDLMETAQRNVATARMLRNRQAVNDAQAPRLESFHALSEKITMNEKWLIRHLSKRPGMDIELLGAASAHLEELGLIKQVDGKASLTMDGNAINSFWEKS